MKIWSVHLIAPVQSPIFCQILSILTVRGSHCLIISHHLHLSLSVSYICYSCFCPRFLSASYQLLSMWKYESDTNLLFHGYTKTPVSLRTTAKIPGSFSVLNSYVRQLHVYYLWRHAARAQRICRSYSIKHQSMSFFEGILMWLSSEVRWFSVKRITLDNLGMTQSLERTEE